MINLIKQMWQYRFHLPTAVSPTYFNVAKHLQDQGWVTTESTALAHFSDRNFDFDINAAETLEFKHYLARLVAHYCPEVMPTTYCINDRNWNTIVNEIANKYYITDQKMSDKIDNLVWILKPSLQNNGQNIKIFSHLGQIEQHYLNMNRLGGEHVLQQYILHPHLLDGKKYSIRMFVIVTNYAGAFLYPDGYFNVARNDYYANTFSDLSRHITNEHLTADFSNVTQIPTKKFDNFFPDIFCVIQTEVSKIIAGLLQLHPAAFVGNKQRTLAIFGFDFIVDTNMRVWLIEANHGPCFPTDDTHPLQQVLYHDFWQSFIKCFVLPIARKQKQKDIKYEIFEKVSPS